MKGHYNIFAIGLLVIVACQNDDAFLSDEQSSLEFYTSAEIDTRTSLQDGNKVMWNEGDAVAVYDYITTKTKFIAVVEEGIARFKGNITPKYAEFVAVYPYDLAADNNVNKSILVTLPSEQTAVKNGFGPNLNLSIGKGSRNTDGSPSQVRFRNICQLFKLSVPAYAANRIAKIELTANSAIAGQLTVDYSDYSPVVTTNEQGAKTIALLPPSESTAFTEGTYYMVLAPETVEGFTLTLTDTNGKTYSQHSSASVGGNWGVICNLGNVDLIEKPVITPQHVYENGTLVGTKVTLTAPVSDKAWSAVIKNTNGETVRTLAESTGTLTTDHTDANWPYLPKGNYTVEYTYTTANGKQMNATSAFTINENPQFSVTLDANSTYSYYLAGDVDKANRMDKNTVTGIVCQAHGILPSILANDKYGFALNNNFNGTIASTGDNVANYNDISITQLGETELTASVTFDGISKTGNKKIYITGLPFRFEPPTTKTWTSDGGVKDGEGQNGSTRLGWWQWEGNQSLTYDKVNIPANTKLALDYKFIPHGGTVNTTFTISVGNQTIASGQGKYYDYVTHEGRKDFSNSQLVTYVKCNNSYGAEQSGTDLYLVALSYRH
ncbi:MAG: hypothetical protein IIW93_05445 [Bacteroidaceae bacterium]|nr:hypothetical protein [Bacteroidaceae bacterium]